ncbi:MAG TPA: prolipoprotein diacylglyceryl transferase family protein [Candidatus Solibacter sp.]|nr:prolipoprotein diacylglyceryl transferase family protein [Candidatus Solibacter sp.]
MAALGSRLAAKLLYGLLFAVVLPLLLVIWARRTSTLVNLPAIHSLRWGLAASAVGVLLMVLGMESLWRLGGGLPMNAFPPPRFVSGGIYRLFAHPIYIGFATLCVGVAVAVGSASGLWLVSTTVILASAALVLGYELPDMQARFGDAFPKQRLLPADDVTPPTGLDRGRCYLTVLLPWLLLYEAIVYIGVPVDARIADFVFESDIPVLSWTALFYFSVYVVVPLVPLIVRTRRDLRWFSSRSLISMIFVFPLYLVVPMYAPPRPIVSQSTLAMLLRFDQLHDGAAATFPSYHVIWAFLAAGALGRNRWQKWLGGVWAVLVTASCVITGTHAVVDVLAALALVCIIMWIDRLRFFLRHQSESLANSWHEWRVGPIRIINHGAYAGMGVFVGLLIIDTLLGPRKSLIPFSIFAGGTIGAALWAQWIEGSPALLRPLGFYGGMIGTALGGILAASQSGTNIWLVLSALAVAAPWIQGIGRLRCLVQGCCHGRPADSSVGIRYFHPRSRVSRIESLRGVPLHPTPIYSLLWNIVVAMTVSRVYLLHPRATMVGGIYLILSGVGRFVEEAYRGEPQTRVLAGLRIYQWIALASVVVGAFLTSMTGAPRTPEPEAHLSSITVAFVCAAVAWVVTGVDVPESNRRFARLT